MKLALATALLLSTPIGTTPAVAERQPLTVASKPFGESYLLCEMFAQLLEARGIGVERRPGLGATELAFSALREGRIDVYPEYTGTGLLAILGEEPKGEDPQAVYGRVAREFERRWGIRWLPPLGFENTYAIAMRRETAEPLGLHTLGDLARHRGSRELRAGFTADFIGRADGLVGLERAYGLRLRDVRPLSAAVKYQALRAGAVDLIDGYSTDGLLARGDLVVLEDDRHFFPPYQAAALVGPRLRREWPEAIAALTELSGRLDADQMRALNERVEVGREPVTVVARDALASLGLLGSDEPATGGSGLPASSLWTYLWQQRRDLIRMASKHLMLVGLALLAAIAVALPLGLALEQLHRGAEGAVRAIGLLQTIPGIALLAFMLPWLGIGTVPALVALFLYALYPIVRNTYAGVRGADPAAVAAAHALGMTPRQVLLWVRLPLAAPIIMAGVRTAGVITVGTATLAAFIGAGGLGDPIVAGLALNDTRRVLMGALPAALLALLVDGALGLCQRALMPKGVG
ncbi:MAG: ABC transporter permease subunit [Deltaproteobacteria bacterium]|nr:ABC transporter permease subunit [Deltaproteobacteria bacterium]